MLTTKTGAVGFSLQMPSQSDCEGVPDVAACGAPGREGEPGAPVQMG